MMFRRNIEQKNKLKIMDSCVEREQNITAPIAHFPVFLCFLSHNEELYRQEYPTVSFSKCVLFYLFVQETDSHISKSCQIFAIKL